MPVLVNNPVKFVRPFTTVLFNVPALVNVPPAPEIGVSIVVVVFVNVLKAVRLVIALPLVENVPALTLMVGKVAIACEALKDVLG